MDGIPALPLSLAYSTEEEKNKAHAPLSHSETWDWRGFGSFGIATRVPNRKLFRWMDAGSNPIRFA